MTKNEISTSLKSRIAEHHAKAQAAAEKAITHALEAGTLLLQVKGNCDHAPIYDAGFTIF